jgi:hypothetical protein
MEKTIKNASQLPKRYFGMHFVDGVAEYFDSEENKNYRIFINQDTAKKMNKTFEGCPLYVGHVEKVNLKNLEMEKDGVVVKSFYNPKDGKHWCEFMVETDRGHEAISKGFRLSNAYHPVSTGSPGQSNGVQYEYEILDGKYEHLSLVDDPRYQESIVLTPEEFEEYNLNQDKDLKMILNSRNEKKEKGENEMLFFNKKKVENQKEMEAMIVTLPKSKKEFELSQIINMADEAELEKSKKPEDRMANGEDMVDCYSGKMTVNQLIEKYNAMIVEKDTASKNAETSETEVEEDETMENETKESSSEEKEKKTNSKEINKQGYEYYQSLKNAHENVKSKKVANVIYTDSDRLARGREMFGSKK